MEPIPLILYNDDRLFVLDINVTQVREFEGHPESEMSSRYGTPEDKWTLTTRRNISGYPPVRVDHFDKVQELIAYVRRIEPTTPLRSNGGQAPDPPSPFEEYLAWLEGEGLMGAFEQKLERGGYHVHPDWRSKLEWEATAVAEALRAESE